MAGISSNRYLSAATCGILTFTTSMNASASSLLILIAGPYRSNTGDDPAKIARNLHQMNAVGLEIFRRGHVPVTGEALALPLIELAGSQALGDAPFNEIFHPLPRRLIPHVDAVLRVGGASQGADEMVALARAADRQVFTSVEEIPVVS